MGLEVRADALDVLRRSLELGGVDPATGGVRLRAARSLGGGINVQVELAEAPVPGDDVVEHEGVRLFVDPEITRTMPDAVVALEPEHDVVVVRPAEEKR